MLNSFYPVIMVNDVKEMADFLRDSFQFDTTFESDWYISLKSSTGHEVAIIARNHESIPDGYRNVVSGNILNFEVDSSDTMYEKMKAEGKYKILKDIKTEDFGQRHFIIEGPEKILVDIIEITEPTEEFKKLYTEV